MNTTNGSTRVPPFVLKTGHSPQLLPPLITPTDAMDSQRATPGEAHARTFIETMEEETNAAKDSLLTAKVHQAHSRQGPSIKPLIPCR